MDTNCCRKHGKGQPEEDLDESEATENKQRLAEPHTSPQPPASRPSNQFYGNSPVSRSPT